MDTLESIDLAERKGICFYACRLPGSSLFTSGFSKAPVPGIHKGGFVVAPFDSAPVTIKPDIEVSVLASLPDSDISDIIPASTPKCVHLDAVERGKAALAESGAGKIVISRVLTIRRRFKVSALLESLSGLYPEAFVFAYHIPGYGLWAGASPELLLDYRLQHLTTVSLAGTRSAGTAGDWDLKNREEQELVTRHILRCLSEEGYEAAADGPSTYPAGPVEHLRTLISADSIRLTPAGAESLLSRLSPTPALGGYPTRWAACMIPRIESHSRGCYGGYLGMIGKEGEMSLYVNLRSMKIGKDKAALYAGGGITPLSVPADEWKETQIKASTLLKVIRGL